MIATSLQNPALSKCLMADQDCPLDLTVKKNDVESSNQDGVLDLSTKKNISLISHNTLQAIPVVKRLPPDENHQEINHNGLTLQGLQELLTQKNRFFAQPSSFSLTSLEMVGFLCSSQSRPVVSADHFWEKPELDGVQECKQANNHLSDFNNHSVFLGKYGNINKGSSKNDPPRNSLPVDLKIPQVKSMDLSWNWNHGNISRRYDDYNAVTTTLQTDHSLSRRLRTILPKEISRDRMGNLFDGGGISENLATDADQMLTSGSQYPSSDPEADLTVSKQLRKKRGRYRQYNSEILEEAISVVMSGKMSVSKAQNVYGIPHSTLEYKVKERLGTLKNPPKRKFKRIMRVNKEDSVAAETLSAPTAPPSNLQEEAL